MKKTALLVTLFLLFSYSIGIEKYNLLATQGAKPSDHDVPMAMNATPTPMGEDIKKGNLPTIDQPKQQDQLDGYDPSIWTPAYLKVKNFKKCLAVEDYRGWQGYCLPPKQPKDCPKKSWKKLSKMNLIPCSNSDD